MIRAIFVLAVACMAANPCRAEDEDDLFLGRVVVGHGKVMIRLCSVDDKAWLNGVPIEVNDRDVNDVQIRPGDTIIHAAGRLFWCKKPISARTFEYYHFDRIEGDVAWFTQRTYSVKAHPYGREGAQIFPDKLLLTRVRRVGVHEASDGGPGEYPGVEIHSSGG